MKSAAVAGLPRALASARSGSPLSAAFSTLAVTPFNFDADGIVVADVDGTMKTAGNVAIPDLVFSTSATERLVSAAASTVVANPSTIDDDGVDSSVITVRVENTVGRGVWGIPAARVVLSLVSGTGTLTQPSGFTNYDGVITGSLVSASAGTCVVRATVLGLAVTQTASVVVTGTPGLLTPVFFSDWSTATGTGTSAIGDGGKWGTISGSGNEVIASTGLDFPTTNVLRSTALVSNSGFAIIRTTGLGTISVGSTRYYRTYYRFMSPDGVSPSDNQTHPIQDGDPGSQISWEFALFTNTNPRSGSAISAGNYIHSLQFHTNNDFNTAFRFTPPELPKDETHRWEIALSRISTTEFNLSVRVYDSSDVLVLDDADFLSQNGAVSLADTPTILFNNSSTAASMDGLNHGCNGVGGTWVPSSDFVYSYTGGTAICDDQGWIGPFGSVDGE